MTKIKYPFFINTKDFFFFIITFLKNDKMTKNREKILNIRNLFFLFC